MATEKVKSNLDYWKYSVKDKLSRDHPADEQGTLNGIYKHEIKGTIKALKFIDKRTKTISKSYWNKLLDTNIKCAELFAHAMGAHSLEFKGIEDYYKDFDEWQSEKEEVLIHPKERAVFIKGVDMEVSDYVLLLQRLKIAINFKWEFSTQIVHSKIQEAVSVLKDMLKVIKTRTKVKHEYDFKCLKVESLSKKKDGDLKKEEQFSEHKEETSALQAKLFMLDDKIKTTFPHLWALVEEFVENLTKLILCQQLDIFNEVRLPLSEYSKYYGLLERDDGDGVNEYNNILSSWENNSGQADKKIRNILSNLNHDKHTEFDTRDEHPKEDTKEDLKKHFNFDKFVSKANYKLHSKSMNLKPKYDDGVFSRHLTTDTLDAFNEFNDPTKFVDEDVSRFKPHQKPVVINKADLANIYHRDSLLSISSNADSKSQASQESDDDISSISSSVSSINMNELSLDSDPNDLSLLYNSAKNDIKSCPVPQFLTHQHNAYSDGNQVLARLATYKLSLINDYFDTLLRLIDMYGDNNTVLKAKSEFKGEKPGDLSFHKGDNITVLPLPNSPNKDVLNLPSWVIGTVMTKHGNRTGFVPRNCLE